ncbi:MAG TPA: N-methyl-L-tryptophan oxidase [Gemmatales bacterium]|nr:N-methyl-L-tryptophan oxidase [Gemmatales bacterium]
MRTFDTIILGLGAMGSAATLACVQRGQTVLGLEQFPLVHDQGSSHGHSRIIREVYYEHPAYVPLVQEAFHRWNALEEQTGQSLLTRCACANMGPPESEIIQGVQRAADDHRLSIETWDAQAIRSNIPAITVPDDFVAVVEANAGWLRVEECVRNMHQLASRLGATLRDQERVTSWKCTPQHVEVVTNKDSYQAGHLIITAGPWAGQMLTELGLPLRVMRQQQLWFTPPEALASQFAAPELPIFMIDTAKGHFYGIPSQAGPGVKIAQHYGAPELLSPDGIHRSFSDHDLVPVSQFLHNYLPALVPMALAASAVCIYTLSPDRHFIIDRHPHHERVALATGFSGHGFKFAPVIGEMLADLLENKVRKDTQRLFAINRF